MSKHYLKLSAIAALLVSNTVAQAMPFNSFDPRSMSMGGAGVAVGDPSIAPFFNPAMLTATDPSKKYSIEFPIIGMRLFDPSNMHTNLSTLSDNITALSASINTVNANSSSTSPSVIALVPGNMTSVANNIDKVNNSLISLSNQPLQGEFGAATVIGIPGKNWGMAFYADAWGAMGGTLEYKDATTLSNLSTDVKTAANVLSGATSAASNPAAQAACTAVLAGNGLPADVTTCVNYAASLNNLSGSLSTASQAVNFNTNTQMASQIHIRGVAVSETGLSISHNFLIADHAWSFGLTPKIMNLQLFDAKLAANNGNSTSSVTGSDYLAQYNTVNFDLGAAKSYNNGWRTGLVVKNVIPQTFEFKNALTPGATPVANGSTLTMNPQVRVGVSRENSWSTLAVDIDVTKNNPAGLETQSQFVALGGELSAWGWAQLRAGYRYDLVNPAQAVVSLGFGLSPRIPYFKPHFDLAITGSPDVFTNAANATQVGASLKAGFNF
jgi:hypothetical protein